MLVKKDKISIRISFSKDDLNSSLLEKIIYEDSQYLVSILRLKNFLSAFKEIKPFEILSERENGKYLLHLPINLESSETKISVGTDSGLISKLGNHSSKLAAPFFLKSFHTKNLVLKNYQLDKKSLGSLHDWSHAGRIGNWLTINGKKFPEYSVNKNGYARLRFINASNARILSFGSSLNGMKIISIDGMSVEPFIQDKFNLGPGQRIDLLINTADMSSIDFFEVSGKKPLSAFKLNVNQSSKKNILKKKIKLQSFKKIPPYKNPKILKIHMQGGAMGNLAKAYFEGVEKNFRSLAMEDKKFWAFNKEVGKYEHSLASVKKGEIIILDVWNDSRWPHSMHLHGNHFYVESKEFSDDDKLILRDTYLMQPGEKSKFIYIADNPGKWLFHCHMLEHAASGMIGYIEVV